MMRVLKWELPLDEGMVEIPLSRGATILGVAGVGGKPCLYTIESSKADPEKVARKFHIAYTGIPFDGRWDTHRFLGTLEIILRSGQLIVLHVFEVNPSKA